MIKSTLYDLMDNMRWLETIGPMHKELFIEIPRSVRKLERRKYFPLLIITCYFLELLLSFLCSSLILVHQEIAKTKTQRSRTLDVGTQSRKNPYIGESPIRTLPSVIQMR